MKHHCIDENILAGYFDGGLTDAEKIHLMEHLSDCSTCREEFSDVSDLMKNEDLNSYISLPMDTAKMILNDILGKKSLRGRIKNRFRPLIDFFKAPDLLQAQAVRDDTLMENVYLSKNYNQLKICLYVEKSADKPNKICIRVRKTDPKTDPEIDFLTLIREEGGVISKPFDDDETVFDDLMFGAYCLKLSKNESEKEKYQFIFNSDGAHEE